MRRRKRSIISTVLVIALSLGMVLNVNAATVDEAQKKAEELENQKKAAEKEKDSLASQLNSIIADMNDTKEKLEKKQDEIQKAEDELVQAKVDENDQYESMKKRIKFMYENGNSQLLEILVSSDSIGDLLNKAEYVSQISAYDRDMLIEFQDVVKDVEEKEASLKDEYEVLSGLQDELVAKQNEVQALLDSKKIQLADLEKQIGDNAATLQKLIEEAEAERISSSHPAGAVIHRQAQRLLSVEAASLPIHVRGQLYPVRLDTGILTVPSIRGWILRQEREHLHTQRPTVRL